MRVPGRPDVDTMYRVTRLLGRQRLSYSLMGSLAVEVHGARPYTSNIEFLIGQREFEAFCEHASKTRFEQDPTRRRQFVDSRNQRSFEFFLTGHHPGRRGPAPVTFPNSAKASENREGLRVLTLPWLIQLKLTANTHAELADVVSLIEVLGLADAMTKVLHPSVRDRYRSCLEEVRQDEKWNEAMQQAL